MVRFSIYELTGMFGVVVYLLPFPLERSSRINTSQYFYSLLNLIGASCYLISLGFNSNQGSFITSTLWAAFIMVGSIKMIAFRQKYFRRDQIANQLTLTC